MPELLPVAPAVKGKSKEPVYPTLDMITIEGREPTRPEVEAMASALIGCNDVSDVRIGCSIPTDELELLFIAISLCQNVLTLRLRTTITQETVQLLCTYITPCPHLLFLDFSMSSFEEGALITFIDSLAQRPISKETP